MTEHKEEISRVIDRLTELQTESQQSARKFRDEIDKLINDIKRLGNTGLKTGGKMDGK